MAGPRVLSEGALSRAMPARQSLLEPATVPLPRLVERVGGIQSQYAPSMYLGVWTRLAGFEREGLTRALARRDVIQGTLMRTTIHLVSRRDYWPVAIAVRKARREYWLRAARGRLDERGWVRAAARLRERQADGPVTRAEIDTLLGPSMAVGAGLWVDMIRVPPSGTWERRSANTFAAAEDWVGPEPDLDPREAIDAQSTRTFRDEVDREADRAVAFHA